MKSVRQYAGFLLAVILLYFLIAPFVETQSRLKEALFEIHWGWLLCSFGVILFYWTVYLYPFAILLSRFMEKPVSFRDAFTLFHLANITRYLPGRIWGVVRLLSLSGQFGLSKTAVGSSLTLHVGVETALGGLIALSLLFSKQMQDTAVEVLKTFQGQMVFLTLAIIGILAGIFLCIPKLTGHAKTFLKTFLPHLGNIRLCGNILFTHSLLWLCQGFAFCLFVQSFEPVPWTKAGLLTACFAFAWFVGFLSFLTPGGLGIREGLLGLLLAVYMSPAQASFAALLGRMWMLSAEMILAGVAFFLHRRCYRRQNEDHNL